jgi:hypothetical protein
MVFKRKASFFLDLSGDAAGSGAAKPVTIAVREAQPEEQDSPKGTPAGITVPAAKAVSASKAVPAAKAEPAAPAERAAGEGKPMLTTAEAIAAELRAAQESLPPPSTATFAPDCLNPANALPQKRRRAGANLAGFKAMGASLLRS